MELKLLKFGAEWCGPCKKQKEEFEKNPVGIDIQEIDVDSTSSEDFELIQKYNVRSVPNMIIIDRNGKVQARYFGYTPSNKIKEDIVRIQENNIGRFIVIEDFNGYISLISDPDSGDTLVFETYKEAEKESKQCQNGKVIKL